ncbi:3-hydroxyacyl-CoA dehydrogenase family protein [Thermodesulfobacteriota bacterium]
MGKKNTRNVLVVGAGVMGNSIALVFASAGVDVILVDIDQRALTRALQIIESSLNSMADFGKVSKNAIPSILSRIRTSTDLNGTAGDADFVIEVVPEVPDLKKKIFSQLDSLFPDNTIIASNTSALDIFNIVDVKRPERLIITHFFAPAHIIPLVEIVPGTKTSPEIILFTADLLREVGKSPVVMKKYGPGFIVNRIQRAIGEATFDMIEEGLAGPEEIDRAIKLTLGIRLPIIGVVQTFDFQGLDMLLDTMRNYGKVYSFIEEKVKQGRHGVKTLKGIYDYEGRNELDIIKKRDKLFLQMMDYLKEINAFEPV